MEFEPGPALQDVPAIKADRAWERPSIVWREEILLAGYLSRWHCSHFCGYSSQIPSVSWGLGYGWVAGASLSHGVSSERRHDGHSRNNT